MDISDFIRSQLEKFQNDATSNLWWVAIGINTGQIKGSQKELEDYITKHLEAVEPKDLEKNMEGIPLIAYLFRWKDYDRPSEQVLNNIAIVFQLFYKKNPLSILTLGKDTYASESALNAITKIPQYRMMFRPEFTEFIRNYAPTLSEQQLLLIAYAFTGSNNDKILYSKIASELIQLLKAKTLHRKDLQRNYPSETKLDDAIKSHFFPEHKNDPTFFYETFPAQELWRLFMDGKQQDKGWAEYEAREPGCINQLYLAWKMVQNTQETKLTPAYFKELHAICSKGIISEASSVGAYREYKAAFRMSSDTTTFLGYLENLSTLQKYSSINKLPHLIGFSVASQVETSQLDQVLDEIIEEYEASIVVHAGQLKELLKDILLLVKKLVHVHPFADCNGRLFCNLILNKELIRHGFTPTILDNPNRLDGYSTEEAVAEVVRGMDDYLQVKIEGHLKGKRTQEFLETQKYPIPNLMKDEAVIPLQAFFKAPNLEKNESVAKKSPAPSDP